MNSTSMTSPLGTEGETAEMNSTSEEAAEGSHLRWACGDGPPSADSPHPLCLKSPNSEHSTQGRPEKSLCLQKSVDPNEAPIWCHNVVRGEMERCSYFLQQGGGDLNEWEKRNTHVDDDWQTIAMEMLPCEDPVAECMVEIFDYPDSAQLGAVWLSMTCLEPIYDPSPTTHNTNCKSSSSRVGSVDYCPTSDEWYALFALVAIPLALVCCCTIARQKAGAAPHPVPPSQQGRRRPGNAYQAGRQQSPPARAGTGRAPPQQSRGRPAGGPLAVAQATPIGNSSGAAAVQVLPITNSTRHRHEAVPTAQITLLESERQATNVAQATLLESERQATSQY